MENKSIWDLISSIGLMQNKNKTSQEENATENSSSAQENNANKQENTPRDKSLPYGSFAKTYNPFASPMLEKPQITSARVDSPTRTNICLNGSKNLVNGQVTDKTKNIVDLINRHNAFSQKFKK